MSTIRTRKDDNYFVANNAPFNDKRLSWEARGMMGYLLSKPNNWTVRLNDLVNQTEAGVYKVRAILKELEACGYINRQIVQNEKGLFEWETHVYESPAMNPKQNQPSINPSNMDASIDEELIDIVNTELVNTESLTPQAASDDFPPVTVPPSTPSMRKVEKKGDGVDMLLAYAGKAQGKADVGFLYEHLRPLATAFIQAAGDGHKPIRNDHKKWCKIVGEWYELHYTPEQITKAVEKMRRDGLTIGGPESVTKIARDIQYTPAKKTSSNYVDVF